MFENEVNYRLAKLVIACMRQDGLITDGQMQTIWKKAAALYEPPLLAVDTVGGDIGDGVSVDGR